MGDWRLVLAVYELPALATAVEQALVLLVVGVVVFLAVAVQFLKVHELYGGTDAAARDRQTNCPSCGARVVIEADECEYCGEALPDGPSQRQPPD